MKQSQYKEIIEFIKKSLYSTFASSENKCLVCGTDLSESREYICPDCKAGLDTQNTQSCPVCGRLVEKGTCRYCRENEKPYEKIHTIFEYKEPVSGFINEFKEQGKTIYGRMFVKEMIHKYDETGIENIDLITSVPANKLRKIFRLRDAPRYFAKSLSKHIGIEYNGNCLNRKGFAKAMRKKTSTERLKSANKSYAIGSYDVQGRNILLIDDVFTTGATTHVCANLLLKMGAKSVNILAMVCVRGR
ncbi:MAG: hypothetical protein AB1Z23_04570 [Eubacteriales bacterium]